ncbi:hypothetical protein ACFRMO_03890 [Streptomyces anulatus]|uniref:hypothetical protein n=1 Tax=Streptomyces TaxID=1883 RepID=UPI0006D9F001|nr:MULTISPECIES: hypothetical protein [Streptomyces]MDF9804456.1 hypothetical protein [Streptomyces sp. HB372]KPL33640.1 hypothetical protein JI76_14600 [Streptomyces anulatus]KQX33158.1 hypothetical protein ASD29_12940 [Streptomyces sp. Root1295]KRA48441.1 hypothetical protein ASD97_32835 [Streptomyces sp. Root63]MBT1105025.1 hypothetical protein [Streptomyces sp. Tu10]
MDIQGAAPAPREIDTSGLPMDQAQALVLDELRALTERAEPFAAILLMPAPPEGRTPAASASGTSTADRVRTLKLIRPGLTALCRGLAFVAPADIPAERAEAIHSGEQLWGCPTMATQDVTAARAWAGARVGG